MTDHYHEMFTPADDKAADGTAHAEVYGKLACTCGFTATATAELDTHLLQVFTPANQIGSDGKRHAPISAESGS
jgi:hypothetical protein